MKFHKIKIIITELIQFNFDYTLFIKNIKNDFPRIEKFFTMYFFKCVWV